MVELRSRTKGDSVAPTPAKGGQHTANGGPSTRKATRKDPNINGVPLSLYRRRIIYGTTAAIVFIGVLGYLLHSQRISLHGNFSPEKASGFGSKVEVTFRFLILPTLWILANIIYVMWSRVQHPEALDPLNDFEHLVEVPRNILRNSIEQLVLSVVAQLAVISYLSGPEVAKIIPATNLLFFIGRIIYAATYPTFRSFGFCLSFIPSTGLVGYALYKFITVNFLSW